MISPVHRNFKKHYIDKQQSDNTTVQSVGLLNLRPFIATKNIHNISAKLLDKITQPESHVLVGKDDSI
ncbi:unnamed protein product [Fusarium graminearum]|uniref:Uncharacterized protein n=1 Tax=Gibberella zeae TaxID=5518 RepID=A0A679NJG0_GIBZA|nr:unnamed protein product [Fusarium graminearum]CAG1979345.1 unnamed protein product [Fusarium graminearum]CAG1998854.1 unnamed protein product [Fusarium graminearum]CZS73836.1 unnamed protein product [Fusarium graminearum]